ncbi:Lipid A biosynthesis lauroyltransferase [bacterium HR21]|nr:Lipid A biosynthesis lauroyltransferase [bacterium HR21]
MPTGSRLSSRLRQLGQAGLVLVLRALGLLLRGVPWRAYPVVGWLLGRLWWYASPQRRRVTLENLRRAFPEWLPREHARVARRCYTNAGIVLAEILSLAWLSETELAERITFDNPELFAECAARGRGMLLLSAHYGNWEWLACAAGLAMRPLGVPVTVLVKRQSNPAADRWLNRYRTRWGNQVVELSQASWALMRALRRGEALALLADQRAAPENAIWLPFFGVEVPVHAFPAAVALRFRMPVIVGFAQRQPDGRYRVWLEELSHGDLPESPEGVQELARRYLQRVEAHIRKCPELWLWQHRRWKYTRPSPHAAQLAEAE